MEPLSVRVPQMAELLSISRSEAYMMVQKKTIRAVRVGRAVLVPMTAIRAFLDERTEEDAYA